VRKGETERKLNNILNSEKFGEGVQSLSRLRGRGKENLHQ
jgi:hypothetical protein